MMFFALPCRSGNGHFGKMVNINAFYMTMCKHIIIVIADDIVQTANIHHSPNQLTVFVYRCFRLK